MLLSQTFFKNEINILLKFYAVVIQIIGDLWYEKIY